MCQHTYEFSAWVVNVLLPFPAAVMELILTLFLILRPSPAQVLGTYSTGNIPEPPAPNGSNTELFFSTPVNTTSVVDTDHQ